MLAAQALVGVAFLCTANNHANSDSVAGASGAGKDGLRDPQAFFAAMLQTHLDRRGWSIRYFARLTEQNATFVSQVLRSVRRPPLKRAALWADTLGLSGHSREMFFDIVALCHAPPRVVEMLCRHGWDLPVCDANPINPKLGKDGQKKGTP